MEKIYMEESKKQKNSLFNFSVVLSFVVAIIGIFSIGLFGIVTSQKNGLISYAAPLTSDTFNFVKTDAPLGKISSSNSSGGGIFSVPKYYADTAKTIPVFCVEYQAVTENGVTYTKGSVIDDYGLLYLLNHTSAKSGVTVTNYDNSSLETYITQVSIWMYLYEKEKAANNGTVAASSKNYLSADEVTAIKNAVKIVDADDESKNFQLSDGTIYDTYVKPLVDSALKATNYASVTVNAASTNISKTDDEKYYQSDVITVNGDPSSSMKSFDVSVEGIDGVIVIDENGETISSLKNLPVGTKFRIRVPAEKVTETAQNAKINVTGHFDSLTGNYYTHDGLQKVVTVTGTTIDAKSGIEIEFVGVPDTGMNGIQTIYFIGLVVLLCGVGIVYANAKPVKNNQ